MAATVAFGAATHPLVFSLPAKKGTMTFPDLPLGALWMWAALTVSRPLTVNFQHTVPLVAFRVIVAVPDAVGEPFGTSFFPSIFVVNAFVEAEDAARANPGRQTRASKQTLA